MPKLALHSRALRVLYAESNPDDIESTREHMGSHAAHIQLEFVSDGNSAVHDTESGQFTR